MPQTPNPAGREFSHLTHAQDPSSSDCVVYNEKHPLYPYKTFKALTHDKRWWSCQEGRIFVSIVISLVTTLRNVPVLVCQRLHHTLLHIEPKPETQALFSTTNKVNQSLYLTHPTHSSHDMMVLLWRPVPSSTLVHQPHFVSDRLAQNLQLPKTSRNLWDTGISHHSPLHSVVNFDISPIHSKVIRLMSQLWSYLVRPVIYHNSQSTRSPHGLISTN